MRLTHKLLLFFVPVLIITVSSLGFLSYFLAKQHTRDREIHLLEILTRQVTQTILEDRVDLLIQSGLAEVKSFTTAYQNEVYTELTILHKETGKSFHIVHQPSNTLLYSSNPDQQVAALNRIIWPENKIFTSGAYTNDNQQRLYAGLYFPYWEWKVFVSESVDVIAEPIDQLRTITIVATLFASLFGSIFLWWISDTVIIGRVKKLKEATRIISATKKHMPIEFSSRDELSDLAKALSSMSIEIQESIEKIESANRSKTDFLATISHEIRTPLNGLIGSAQLLNKTPLTSAQHDYVDALLKSSQTLSSVINDVLDVSKIESGKLSIERIPVYPTELLQSLEVVFIKLAQDNHNELFCECHCSDDTYIFSDPVRLRQILFNLVGNAVKFTAKGSIHISMSLIPISDEPKSKPTDTHLFCVVIKDTGIGIEESRLEAVFESFTQSDSSTTRNYGGSGLGLTIVKKILSLLQGTISVDSKVDHGSTFTFYIPVEIGVEHHPQPSTPAPLTTPKQDTSWTILLVEDNEINTMVAQHMLQQIGYRVFTVINGEEAVEAVQAHSFDLILMDIHMPIMDGVEATKRIRSLSDPERANTPIIGLTAEAFKERHKEFMAIGMNAVITKPIDETTMLNKIQKVMFNVNE